MLSVIFCTSLWSCQNLCQVARLKRIAALQGNLKSIRLCGNIAPCVRLNSHIKGWYAPIQKVLDGGVLLIKGSYWKGKSQAQTSVVSIYVYEVLRSIDLHIPYEGKPLRCCLWRRYGLSVSCSLGCSPCLPDEHHFSLLKAICGKGVRWHWNVSLHRWVVSNDRQGVLFALPRIMVVSRGVSRSSFICVGGAFFPIHVM